MYRKKSVIITIVTSLVFLIGGSVAIMVFLSRREMLMPILGGYFLLCLFFLSMKLMLIRVLHPSRSKAAADTIDKATEPDHSSFTKDQV